MNTIVEERQDHWLTAILWACQHFGIRCHALKVVNGLPLENGQLSEALFQRAAEQAQLEVGLTSLSLLEQATFPCLAVEKQGNPLLILGREGEHYRCLSPHQANSDMTLSLDELKTQVKEGIWQLSTQVAADGRVESLVEEKPVHWFRQVLMEVRPWYRDLLLASFVINLLAMVVPLFTMNVYDRVVPNQAFHTLWVLSVGVIIVVVFDWVLREARSSVTDMAGRYVENKLSAQLFQKVLGMRLEQRPQSVGAFARQLQDFDSVKDFLTSVSLVTLVDLPFTLFFLLLIGWLGGAMMLIPLAVMAALLLLSFVMKGRLAQTFTESARLSTQRQAHVYDSLSALTDIKQNNAEGMTQKRWEQTVSALSEWQTRSRFYSNIVSHSIMSSQQVVTIALIIFGVYQIAEGLLSMGGLIAIVMLSGRAASSINQLSMLMLRYQQTQTAMEGLNQIMATPQESTSHQVMDRGEFHGNVALRNVSFAYPEMQIHALEAISLDIKAGEKIGVIGNAGSGKSTLMALLARQLLPTAGQMYYETIDAQLWPPSVIRAGIGWVGQNPGLIYGTIYENITFGDQSIDEQRLLNAVMLSGLNDYMPRLANGLETQVGEQGRFLSGGQRQAVAIARAIYRDPAMLLLDEPTSALDKAAEERFFHALQRLPADKTLVISSHKQSFLTLCDRILVLDKGKLVAQGTPHEIFTQQGSARVRSRVKSVSVVKGGQS
ncbi:type I secretion system permease/ATPase [Vibrio vulnificus]|uniref:type I secretion system permease/ATPase n=1 Tax=Vibrio vulnificus TaxID=672 RepID=UPI000722732A|nr:type I secretion system permease/ATPase [Vibrio vulnificus]ALM72754.1 Type I secretion system ATPase, LssB family LapB [Vibrio vulnificus]ANH65115.1 Type I secretion system ATPase, LssB family LapB [Vibrio vulnificus]